MLPSQFINANNIAPDILLQTCTLLYVGHAVRGLQTRRPIHLLFMALWLVAGMLVKPVLYPFVAVHLLLVLVLAKQGRGAIGVKALATTLPVLAIVVYSYTNYLNTGKFHYSSNQAFNALFYYKPYVLKTQGADSATAFIARERARLAAIPNYSQRYDAANRRGTELFQEYFPGYLLFHIQSAAKSLIDPGKAELDLFTGKLSYGQLYTGNEGGLAYANKHGWVAYLGSNPSVWVALLVLIANVARLLLFTRLLLQRQVPLGIRLLLCITIVYFVMAAGPIANTRYLLPVALLLAAGAAAATTPNQPKLS
ncbi:MAG: hypothetical protein EBZ77_09955 [Chitinophagia bacterium]|nr:hypothetical protein [Chitinophagia bacterium]